MNAIIGTSFFEPQQRFKQLDLMLLSELSGAEDQQKAKIVQKLMSNGYDGANYNVIVDTLQAIYIEYNVRALLGHDPESSAAVALVEQWADNLAIAFA